MSLNLMQKHLFEPLNNVTNNVSDIVKSIPNKENKTENNNYYIILKLGSSSYIAPHTQESLEAATALMIKFRSFINEDGKYNYTDSKYNKPEIKIVELTSKEINIIK
tara:strand:+ start:23428 stop:23748 length:321 start_codon:yes stop_codon:yes gene_type:complete